MAVASGAKLLREPVLDEDPEEANSGSEDRAAPQQAPLRALTVAASIAAVLALACAAAAVVHVAAAQHRAGALALGGRSNIGAVTGLVAVKEQPSRHGENEDPCRHYAHLKFEKVLHSNLGNKGPDKGAEGILYDAVSIDPVENTSTQVLVKVNVAKNSVYTPYGTMRSGMLGEYAKIVVKSGTHVAVRVTVLDAKTQEPVKLPTGYLTFFDLDTGANNTSVESVTIGEFSEMHLSENTEVITTNSNYKGLTGLRTFTGSTYGDGQDNPSNPNNLTHEQFNRAVSLTFRNFTAIPLLLKASKGDGPRVFIFVGRPSILCAANQEGPAPPTAAPVPVLAKREAEQPRSAAGSHGAGLSWLLGVLALLGGMRSGVAL